MPRDSKRVAPTFTDAQLDELIALALEDVERAKLAWRQDVPNAFRELLDAEAEPERPNAR